MAKYQLTGPDGRKYQMTAPDEATQDEVLARFQKELGQLGPVDTKDAYKRSVEEEATKRQGPDSYDRAGVTEAGVGDILSFGAMPQIVGAGRATVQKLRGSDKPWTDLYGFERDVYRRQLDKVAEESPVATFASGLAGGAAMLPAAAGTGAATAVGVAAEAIPRWKQALEAGKVGAKFGAVYGFNRETGDFADKGISAAEHAVGGFLGNAALSRAGGFIMDRGIKPLRQWRANRAERAAGVQGDFSEAGMGEAPGFVAGGPAERGLAQGLAPTLVGGNVREQAAQKLAQLEGKITETLQGQGMTPARAGEEAQTFIRTQLTNRLSEEEIAQMDPVRLFEISGIAPSPERPSSQFRPPRVEPTQPRDIPAITPQQVMDEAGYGVPAVAPRPVESLEGRYTQPDLNDVPLTPELANKMAKAHTTASDAQRRLAAEQEILQKRLDRWSGDLEQQGFVPEKSGALLEYDPQTERWNFSIRDPNTGQAVHGQTNWQGRIFLEDLKAMPWITTEQRAMLERYAKWDREHHTEAQASISQRQSEVEAALWQRDITAQELKSYQTTQLPALAAERRAVAMHAAEAEAQANAALETQRARSAAIAEAEKDALPVAMRRTAEARATEAERAQTLTRQRQEARNREYQEGLNEATRHLGEPYQLGRPGPETLADEVRAAYEAARQNIPSTQPRILGYREPAPRVERPRQDQRYQPDEVESIVQMWTYAKEQSKPQKIEGLTDFVRRMGGIKDDAKEVRQLIGSPKERPGLISKKGMTLDDMALKAHEDGFFPERPSISEFLNALHDDVRGSKVMRPKDYARADDAQVAAGMANDLAEIGVWNAKDVREVRAILARDKVDLPPRVQPDRPIQTPTNITRLIDQMALEGRRRGELKGYREGQPFDADGGLRGDVIQYLEKRLGKDTADWLRSHSDYKKTGQAPPGAQGLHDRRTAIGREIDDLGAFPNQTVAGKERLNSLQRMYDALDRDMTNFNSATRRGAIYEEQRTQIDAAYKDFKRNIEAPLQKIVGANVDPAQAAARLVEATQSGSREHRMLQAFYRVVDAKGDRAQATAWLLHNMMEGGVPGFLRSYRGLSPDARALMSQGSSGAMMARLDTLARVGGHLEKYIGAVESQGVQNPLKLLNAGNILGGLLMFNHIPAAVTVGVGAKVADKILASKWYAGWLKNFPVEKGPMSKEWASALQKFRALAVESAGLDKATGQALWDAIKPAKAAAAGPAGGGTASAGPDKPEDNSWFWQLPRVEGPRTEGHLKDSPWGPRAPGTRDEPSFKDDSPTTWPGYPHPTHDGRPSDYRQNVLFRGNKATTWDSAKAAAAEGRIDAGEDPKKVWKELGVGRDQTGAVMDEMNDSNAKLRTPPGWEKGGKASVVTSLDQVVDLPQLFKDYPKLAGMKVVLRRGTTASKDPTKDEGPLAYVEMEDDEETPKQMVIGFGQEDKEELLRTVLHEVGHLIEGDQKWIYGSFKQKWSKRPGENRSLDIERRQALDEGQRRDIPPWWLDPELKDEAEIPNPLYRQQGRQKFIGR